MGARAIVSILRGDARSYLIDVVSSDHDTDVLVGTYEMAAELAHVAGLASLQTPDGTVLWGQRGPCAWE
jgi:hypothetical protein